MANETDALIGAAEEAISEEVISTKNKKKKPWVLSCIVVGALVAALVVSLRSYDGGDDDLPNVPVLASPKAPRYNATQFISFTINTMGGLEDHGECHGKTVDKHGVCYLGNFNITQDLEHRALILADMLQKLKDDANQKHPKVDPRENVLKILAMPEFYWRGPYGAYTKDQLFGDYRPQDALLIQLSNLVRKMVKDEAFSDYLFFFGTVLSVGSSDPDVVSDGHVLDPTKLSYSNFCPVLKGGPNGAETHSYLVNKKYISTADFLDRAILPNPINYNDSEYKREDFSPELYNLLEKRQVVIVNDNVITVDGVKIGMEICLDHRMGALWNNLQQKYNSELVDVQVITSGGMAIERGPNPVVPGGVVYLSDGEASSAACIRTDHGEFDPDKVCRIGPKRAKHLPLGGPDYSEFFSLSSCLQMMEGSDLFKGYYSIYQTQGCAYTLRKYGIDVLDKFEYYPPSLEIYPTVDLPNKANKP